VPLVIASVIEAVLFAPVVTVVPPEVSTFTTGCVPHAVPPVPPPGCVVKTNLSAVNVTVAVCVTVTLSVVSLPV
jgi:hypothetical protein